MEIELYSEYERLLEKSDPKFYNLIKDYVDYVPDQRLFEDKFIKSKIKEWTPALIWELLYNEIEILQSAKERGDNYDEKIYRILSISNIYEVEINTLIDYNLDNFDVGLKKLLIYNNKAKSSKSRLSYNLINFIATYPILSYLIITIYQNYPLAIIGRHPILINEIVNNNFLRNIKEKKGHKNIPQLYYSNYATQWVVYSRNINDIRLLLSKTLKRDYLAISDLAASTDNANILIVLWDFLDKDQKMSDDVIYSIIILDLLDLFKKALNISDIKITDRHWQLAIRNGSTKILQYFVDNYEINNTDIIFSELINLENRVPIINILSTKYNINRFSIDGEEDLLQKIISSHDYEALKAVAEIGMDIKTLIRTTEGFILSPLLYFLDEPSTVDMRNYMLNKYDTANDKLLYNAIVFNLHKAIENLLEVNNYSDKILTEAIVYSCNRNTIHDSITFMLLDKLGIKLKQEFIL